MSVTLTAQQIHDLDRMNEASRRAGGLGTLLMGGISIPDAGSISSLQAVKYSLTPAIGSATYVHAAIALTASAQTAITTGITNPDFPRLLSAKGNASGIVGNVVITGTDFNDAEITDTIALSGASEVAGTKAFKTVTNISLPAETNAGTDTVSIGAGNKFGFPIAIPNASVVLAKTFDGSVDAGTTTVGATLVTSVYAPAGTVNGVKVLSLVILA